MRWLIQQAGIIDLMDLKPVEKNNWRLITQMNRLEVTTSMKVRILLLPIVIILYLLFNHNLNVHKKDQKQNLESNKENLLKIEKAEIKIPIPAARKEVSEEDIPYIKELLEKLYSSSLDGVPRNNAQDWIKFTIYITRLKALTSYEARIYVSYDVNLVILGLTSDEITFTSRVMIDAQEISETVDYLATKYQGEKKESK